MSDMEDRLRDLFGRRVSDVPAAAGLPRGVTRRVRRRRARNVVGVGALCLVVTAGIVLPLKALSPLAGHGVEPAAGDDYHGLPAGSPLMVAGPGEFYYRDIAMPMTCSSGDPAGTWVIRTWLATDGSGRMIFDPPADPNVCDVGYGLSSTKGGYGEENGFDVTYAKGEHPIALVDLSADPAEALAQLQARNAPGGASPGPEPLGDPLPGSGMSEDDTKFYRVFGDILTDTAGLLPTPSTQVGLFGAARTLPGMQLTDAIDPQGRPAVALTFPIDLGDGDTQPIFYFDPSTLQLLASTEFIVRSEGIVKSIRDVPTGAHDLVAPRPEPSPAAPSGAVAGLADVAEVSCIDGRAQVATAQVRAQQDGVHIAATTDGGSSWLEISADFSLPQDFASEGAGAPDGPSGLELPPGDYRLRCVPAAESLHPEPNAIYLGFPGKQSPAGAMDAAGAGAPLTVVDPDTLFTPYAMDCAEGTSQLRIGGLGPEGDGIPDPSLALPRNLSGIRSGDVISRVGYPDTWGIGTGQVWQISRDGSTIALFRVRPWGDGIVVTAEACKGAGIDAHADPATPPATAYAMPGYQHCSPYFESSCVPVWISYTIEGRANGEDVRTGSDDNASWCQGPDDNSCAIHPNDMAYVVFMARSDADRWFAEHDCGGSIRELCRPSGFSSGMARWGNDWYEAPAG